MQLSTSYGGLWYNAGICYRKGTMVWYRKGREGFKMANLASCNMTMITDPLSSKFVSGHSISGLHMCKNHYICNKKVHKALAHK